jgi:hypothetical protein
LEWNVALESSDGVEGCAAPGPSTLHSIDKMYRNMSAAPPSFPLGSQAAVRPSFADASGSQSALDDAVLKAKAKEKIKQFVVGDASAATSYASGASQFTASSRPPVAVTRSFSAPVSTMPQPSITPNQPWQIPFVPENNFPAQQQVFPAPNRPLADPLSIWGASSAAPPVPFNSALTTPSWGSFASITPQPQNSSIVEHAVVPLTSGQQQPAVADESLFFFESIDE